MADTFQNENPPLHNRTLHINGTFKEIEKPDIEIEKPDIDTLKLDIENGIDIKSSRASDLLKEMAEHGIIEPVSGHGKGRYRFRQQEG